MNVIICGVVKQCGNVIKRNIDLAIKTGELFNKYKVIVYENNSTDNTKEVLGNYLHTENIVIICEDIDPIEIRNNSKSWSYTSITGNNSPCRVEQICNARNKVLEELNKNIYDEYNYVIWIDMDCNSWSIDGIMDSMNKRDQWDIIYANGIEKKDKSEYYDLYAYRTETFLYGPELLGEPFWRNLPKFDITDLSENLIPVYSAFGGIGIFKKDIFKNHKYDCIVNEPVKKFYRNFINSDIYNNNKHLIENKNGIFINGYIDESSNMIWKSNSGFDQPVVCEHIPLNLELFNENYRIFINPKMFYFRY